MRKSQVVEILARRLVKPPGRVEEMLKALQAEGIVSVEKGSRRFPGDATEDETVALVLAAVCDVGAAQHAADHVRRFGKLRCESGATFREALAAVLAGHVAYVGHIIVGAAGVSTVLDGMHTVFGTPPTGAAAIAPGDTILAIAAELQGAKPADADALAALAHVRRALD